MNKIPIRQFKKILEYDVVAHHACIEINFSIDDSPEYTWCWLGKTIFEDTSQAVYWFGLAKDGSQAYEYSQAEALLDAPVFKGKSMRELWNQVTLYSIDGCDADIRLPFYLDQALR